MSGMRLSEDRRHFIRSRAVAGGGRAADAVQRWTIRQRWSRWVMILWLVCCCSSASWGRDPGVRFDTASLVCCRDVTTSTPGGAASPQERLMEGTFQVTAVADDRALPDDVEYVYRFLSPSGRLRIVDYDPKTQQTSRLAGNVNVEKNLERSRSLGINLSGSFQHLVNGSAGADVGDKNASSLRYELKPPMQAVVVAGTLQRGTGVFFKLRPSPDASLEGAHDFRVVMRVPASWRGDVMYLRCETVRRRHGDTQLLGVARFVIGLHASGDEEARVAAERLVSAESILRRTAAQQAKTIERRSYPSVLHKVGALLDIVDPRIPDSWLERLVYGSIRLDQQAFYQQLPQGVQRAAATYEQAKRRMFQLSGNRLALRPVAQING